MGESPENSTFSAIVDVVLPPSQSSLRSGWGYSTKFYTGTPRPEVQLLISLSYTFLTERYAFHISIICITVSVELSILFNCCECAVFEIWKGAFHDLITWSTFGKHENSSLFSLRASSPFGDIVKSRRARGTREETRKQGAGARIPRPFAALLLARTFSGGLVRSPKQESLFAVWIVANRAQWTVTLYALSSVNSLPTTVDSR